jgi:gas vesicle protein
MKLSFLKGVLWGVLAGILLAPKSGRETRDEIKKTYGEITDRISEELALLKEVTADTYGQVTQSVVNAYLEAKKITTKEAEQIVAELKEGYDKIRIAHEEGIKREIKSA